MKLIGGRFHEAVKEAPGRKLDALNGHRQLHFHARQAQAAHEPPNADGLAQGGVFRSRHPGQHSCAIRPDSLGLFDCLWVSNAGTSHKNTQPTPTTHAASIKRVDSQIFTTVKGKTHGVDTYKIWLGSHLHRSNEAFNEQKWFDPFPPNMILPHS